MKKKMLYAFVFCMLLLPFKVNANGINHISILPPKEVMVGTEFQIDVKIAFKDVEKAPGKLLGLIALSYEFNYDEEDFIIVSYEAPGFVSSMEKDENGKTQAVSLLRKDASETFLCENGAYCSEFIGTIKMYVKNTNARVSTIKIDSIEAVLYKGLDVNKELTDDESVLVTSKPTDSQIIKIKRETEDKPVEPEPEPEKILSSNAYLKSLTIENYDISFSPTTRTYKIEIDKDVNQLNISAETEDEKATYQIIGADNLKENDSKVIITVTAENGNQKVYTIKTKLKQNIETEKKEDIEKKFKMDKNMTKGIVFAIVGFFVFIFICWLIFKIRNYKMDKLLDKL